MTGTEAQTLNHRLRLTARPSGLPTDADFEVTADPVTEPAEGRFTVRVSHVSLDPAMRGWMTDRRSYVPPVGLGEVMRAYGAGEVVASRHPGFAVGDAVTGLFGVQEFAESDGGQARVVDTGRAPLAAHLGVLGLTGITAYFGITDVGHPAPGDTVVVSGAAGATGHVAGQLARIAGCRVIGIAGGPEKCAWLTEGLGFDAALDHKLGDLPRRLAQATPDGVQVFFDNVGGPVLEAALNRITLGARVVLCGGISQYNSATPTGPANYMSLVVNRARMEGFLVTDYADRYAEATTELGARLRSGELRTREDVVDGEVGDFAAVLGRLFRGENMGKLLLRLR
jgi:NADPH-dependent curcumin reductase